MLMAKFLSVIQIGSKCFKELNPFSGVVALLFTTRSFVILQLEFFYCHVCCPANYFYHQQNVEGCHQKVQ